MSDYRYMYMDKHGAMMDGMNKGSKCKRTCSLMDEQTMHAKRCVGKQAIVQRCVHGWTDGQTCEDVFADRSTDEHTLF